MLRERCAPSRAPTSMRQARSRRSRPSAQPRLAAPSLPGGGQSAGAWNPGCAAGAGYHLPRPLGRGAAKRSTSESRLATRSQVKCARTRSRPRAPSRAPGRGRRGAPRERAPGRAHPRRDEQPGAPVLDDVRHRVHLGPDARHGAGHGVEEREAERLGQGGQCEDGRLREQPRDGRERLGAELQDTLGHQLEPTRSDDEQPRTRAAFGATARRRRGAPGRPFARTRAR